MMLNVLKRLRCPLLLVGFAVLLAACDVNAVPKLDQMQIQANILQNPEALQMFEQNQGALSSAL